MKLSGFRYQSFFGLLLIFIQSDLCAQIQDTVYKPHLGQPGKDIIWVPTPNELVDKMLELAEINGNDFVIDLGSGDGRTVIAAAKLGAKALGIEFNHDLVELSEKKAELAGVSSKAKFIEADLFKCDLSEATVITMFLSPELNLKLRPRLLDLKAGTRVVSNTFSMGKWDPDFEALTRNSWDSWYTALMWIIPAKIEGTWKLRQGVLTIHQEFQMFYGTLKSDTKTSVIKNGRLNGDQVTFYIDSTVYAGHLTRNNILSGVLTTNSVKSDWTARRVEQ
jgi:SAM-dependent methyltransferase